MDPTVLVPVGVAGGVVALAVVCGSLVATQLRGMGVPEPQDGIRWPKVLGTLVAWIVALGGLAGTADLTGLGPLAGMIQHAFDVVVPLLPAAIVLCVASTWARGRREDAARRQDATGAVDARWGMLAAGVLAALVAVQADVVPALLLLLALGVVAWLAGDPAGRARVLDAWGQLQAGTALRQKLRADTVLHRDGREVVVIGPVGLLATEVLVDGDAQVLPNRELLLLLRALPGR